MCYYFGMDQVAQNGTEIAIAPQQPIEVVPPESLAWRQDQYITFVASSGLSITEDGGFKQIKVGEFADLISTPRRTLYNWQQSIPEFWEKVDIRRREIFTRSRENAIWKGLTLKAMKGDTQAATMVLSHFGDYSPPAQKHDVKINGLSDFLNSARKRHEANQQKKQNAIDAESAN